MDKEKDILLMIRRKLLGEVARIEARLEEMGVSVKEKKGKEEEAEKAA